MQALVTKDNVTISQEDKVHEGEYNVNCINFSFSEEYTNDLVKNAVFAMGDKIYQTSIINNQCNIPSEILSDVGEVFFGVYAYKVNDGQLELRYSPFPTRFTIISGSYNPTAEESQEITPTQFEQYMQALQNGLNDIQNAIDDLNQRAEDGEFDGKDGVGITTVTSGQSTQQDGSTVTPVTVNKTDGTQQTFNVSAKNGIDGQNGTDGNDGVTPNLQVGTVTTLEPNEQATVTRTGTDEEPLFNFGIPKGQQGEQGIQGIPGQDGQPGADGQPGRDGADGKDATINGQNTVEITTDNNITLDQQESVLKLGLNSQLIPKQEAEGTDNTITDALDMNLFALSGDGESQQVVTQGYQLFNADDNITYPSLSINKNNDGSLLINGTADSPGWIAIQTWTKEEAANLSGKNYVLILEKEGSNSRPSRLSFYGATITTKFDTPSVSGDTNDRTYATGQLVIADDNTANLKLGIYAYGGEVFNNFILKPVFAEGTDTSLEYEPYTNGIASPSLDYPQEINSIEGSVEFDCSGKNLFNKNTVVDGYLSQTGQIESNSGFKTSDFIKVMPNTSYFLNNTNTRRLKFYDINKNAITSDWDLTSAGSQSFTTLSNAYYLRFSIDINVIDINTVQLEIGTQATSCEPYIEPNEVTFNLGEEKLRSVGDVKDELVVDLDTGDYYKVENVGEVVFDGSEIWTKSGNTSETNFVGVLNGTYLTDLLKCKLGYGIYSIVNYFARSSNLSSKQGFEFYNDNGQYYTSLAFSIDIDTVSTIEEFKQWLSTHNTIVDYVLQNPTTVPLGTLSSEDLAKLKTFKGYNNVTVNTNLGLMNIRFTYGLDIKKYVDNKIAQLSEQLIKGE